MHIKQLAYIFDIVHLIAIILSLLAWYEYVRDIVLKDWGYSYMHQEESQYSQSMIHVIRKTWK